MKKPKGAGIERPHTMKSGVALQSNYSVQHRSDILMEEQLATVHKLQSELKTALSDLDNGKTEEEVDRCRSVVAEAKEKSEKAFMVLQVLIKVNTELSFARAELDEALEKQEGDINEARKRVMWLEDRMGVLCGKARIRVQGTQKPKSKSFRSPDRSTFRSRMGSDSDKSSESDYDRGGQRMGRNMSIGIKSDTTRHAGMYSASESGSSPPFEQPNRMGMADTPSSDGNSYVKTAGMGLRKGGLDDSDSDSEEDGPPSLPPGMPQISGPGMKPKAADSGSESGSEYSSHVTFQPVPDKSKMTSEYTGSQTYSSHYEEGETVQSASSQRSDLPKASHHDNVEGESEGESEDNEEEEEEKEPVSERQASHTGEDEEEGDDGEDDKPETDSHQSEQSAEIGDSKVKSVFLTEDSTSKMVTIKTPRHGRRQVLEEIKANEETTEEAEDVETTDEDRARDYWFSEHHRFEYSQYSDVLLEIDPLSYHNVGLALPGSFIDKPERGYTDLPWRSKRKGSDITDIHKIALDKLANRVHSLYDKFYDAALLSVRPTQNFERRETTMLSTFDNTRDGARSGTPTDSRPGMVTAPPTTADGLSRQGTVVKPAELHPSKMKPGLNVYHPKPIPPPEMLPLTRMSRDKEYPRLSNMFLKEDDFLVHKPAVRIVDQRNLYKETKLKLYRDKPKLEENALSLTEKKFQLMLEREKSMGSKSGLSSRQSTGKMGPPGTRMSMARTLTKAEGVESETGASTWSRLKPSSRGKEYSGLKWERVKTIVHVSLVSKKPEERRDAAKHLGLLRCGDAMVFYALKDRLRVDDDERTRYEAAKSLILLGCWEEDVLQLMLKYLVMGNTEIRQDLIRNMIDGKNVPYINKKTPSFPELVKVLSHFCRNPDPDDSNAFDAAVLLGKMCVSDENATAKLLRSLEQSGDTHIKAKALEVLVKQLNCHSWNVVQHLLVLLKQSSVWRYRALAADLLIILGKEHVCKKGEEEKIYQILERKIWDDPTRDVRISAAKALAALGMFGKACERIEKRLEDTDEDIRAQAVISVGTLEMKNDKIVRLLLEMLELDPSEYVRLMIARTFTVLKLADKRVLRALRERDKVEGALARESRKALKVLESLAAQPRLTSPTGRKSTVSRLTPRGITPHYTPAVMT